MIPDKRRNLVQYRDLSDEEWEIKKRELDEKSAPLSDKLGELIEEKKKRFEEDYDLDDMKFNDTEALDALCSAMVYREYYEQEIADLLESGLDKDNTYLFDKLTSVVSKYRKDIIDIQSSLNITRKERNLDKSEKVIDKLTELKEKAEKFYKAKMGYVYCPKCKMLLFTGWFLYPEADNKVILTCNRTLEDGSKCGHKFSVTSKDLIIKGKGRNIEEVPNY